MAVKEGQSFYAMLNGVPTPCRVTYVDFGGDGVHLVYADSIQQAFIVKESHLADTSEKCQENYNEQMRAEYRLYYDMIKSETDLILHLLHASESGRKIEGNELKAMIDRASEVTKIDVGEYLDQVNKAEKKKKESV